MPIYEYVCLDCKQEFEVVRPISQANLLDLLSPVEETASNVNWRW
ncbi:MAG: FmdB family zinc ribbon protein [Candidatus Villigracilaceae bacterium]